MWVSSIPFIPPPSSPAVRPQLLSQSPSPTISGSIIPILKYDLVCLFVCLLYGSQSQRMQWPLPSPPASCSAPNASRRFSSRKGWRSTWPTKSNTRTSPLLRDPRSPSSRLNPLAVLFFFPTVRPPVSLWLRLLCFPSGSGGRQRPTARAVPAERGAVWHRAGDLQPRARRDTPHQHHQPSQWVPNLKALQPLQVAIIYLFWTCPTVKRFIVPTA